MNWIQLSCLADICAYASSAPRIYLKNKGNPEKPNFHSAQFVEKVLNNLFGLKKHHEFIIICTKYKPRINYSNISIYFKNIHNLKCLVN